MQTNHLSHFLLSVGLMPSLEQAAAIHGDARIVTMTSGARNMPPSPIEAKYTQPYADGVHHASHTSPELHVASNTAGHPKVEKFMRVQHASRWGNVSAWVLSPDVRCTK